MVFFNEREERYLLEGTEGRGVVGLPGFLKRNLWELNRSGRRRRNKGEQRRGNLTKARRGKEEAYQGKGVMALCGATSLRDDAGG